MGRRVYNTTRPRTYDTYKIALDKWRQRVDDGAVTGGTSGAVTFSNPLPTQNDGKVSTIQKIINALP